MNEWAVWELEKRVERTARALEQNGFRVTVCGNGADAVGRVEEAARDVRTVGFGGSMAAVELDLPGRLAELGKECLVHGAAGLTPEQRLAVMRRQLTCDLFLTGANAVTEDGKIVNIDATGNRVGAMTFGPGHVIVLAGSNKIVADPVEALRRIKARAAPPNARRLSMKTPCAETGVCSDCRSPDRICRVVHIMERRPRLTDVEVLLIRRPFGL